MSLGIVHRLALDVGVRISVTICDVGGPGVEKVMRRDVTQGSLLPRTVVHWPLAARLISAVYSSRYQNVQVMSSVFCVQ